MEGENKERVYNRKRYKERGKEKILPKSGLIERTYLREKEWGSGGTPNGGGGYLHEERGGLE